MTRILGIDPGSRMTGYGIIDAHGDRNVYVTCGCIRVQGDVLPARLKAIFEALTALVAEYRPEEVAVEQVFVHRNADSALKLGQARGAAIAACVNGALSVNEYTPRQVKQAIVGKGSAEKAQVQHMVRVLLRLDETPQADAADALAVALCHSHTRRMLARMPEVTGMNRGRYR